MVSSPHVVNNMSDAILVQHFSDIPENLGEVISVTKSYVGNYNVSISAGTSIPMTNTSYPLNILASSITVTDDFSELYELLSNYLCSGKYTVLAAILSSKPNSISIPTNRSIYSGGGSSSANVVMTQTSTMWTDIRPSIYAGTFIGSETSKIIEMQWSKDGGTTSAFLTRFQGYGNGNTKSPGYATTVPSGYVPYYYDPVNWFPGIWNLQSMDLAKASSNWLNYKSIRIYPCLYYTNTISSLTFNAAFNITLSMQLDLSMTVRRDYI